MGTGRAVGSAVGALALLALAGVARAQPSEEAALSALLRRLWLGSELAPGTTVTLQIRNGLSVNALAAARTIAVSREYLRWTRRFPPAERERVLARTLAHELAHLALGHRVSASPAQELAAEALGIQYFVRAGFDCRWWVEYVGGAAETAGHHGWPPRAELVARAAAACAEAWAAPVEARAR